jgi:hypothetical protein
VCSPGDEASVAPIDSDPGTGVSDDGEEEVEEEGQEGQEEEVAIARRFEVSPP